MSDIKAKCIRCGASMQEGQLNIKQQTFPIEWVEVIPGLNDAQGTAVVGWGAAAQESKIKRKQLENSRRRISAWRCIQCGKLDFYTL
ncbi:hypothetical protein [Methylobacterium sp. NEAU K]|uniref:hypothetical protein n=1 Tax=Methylobacterium sp. NEAU K TaxID=3064946 RepID=UPI0027356FB9|nr:hypothetical protein [Methylobacterium sp. NEAU K]MDP4006628.1 hypothetical protein [Methylobacterium sp. NEAU K]